MTEAERYDAVVIGSGEGGKYLAWDMAQAGQKVAVMERRWIGGSCPNINCLPSKNEIYSARVGYRARVSLIPLPMPGSMALSPAPSRST